MENILDYPGGLNIITDLFKEECRQVRDVYENMQKDGSRKKRGTKVLGCWL